MYIENTTFKTKSGATYHSILLRESFREGGKVKKRTVANLSRCTPEEIAAINFALKNKHNLHKLTGNDNLTSYSEGLSVGAVLTIYEIAKKLRIVDALGNSQSGLLALWQVIARVINQGSRLSAVRLGQTHAIASIINLPRGFNEDALYSNLKWISEHQATLESSLFNARNADAPTLFLYDVTSSYLEGNKNEFADFGYNRDGKKGKKQIVIGLLCDESGDPVSVEVFRGNTHDTKTFASQINKIKERFSCKAVTLVGDRGMIKSPQIADLADEDFHYITAITKKQIETLIRNNTIQLSLFEKTLVEIEDDGVRYILRKNPVREEEIEISRNSKEQSIRNLVLDKNAYLAEHPKAKPESALRAVRGKIKKLHLDGWLSVTVEGRRLSMEIDEKKRSEESKLDGCYVIKTNLLKESVEMSKVHDRYKDLAQVEWAFRTCKSSLDVRPIFVQKSESTRGHVFIVMLAYMIIRELSRAWAGLNITVEEGIASLSTMTILNVNVEGIGSYQEIPEPRELNRKLLEAAEIKIPKVIPHNEVEVATKKKLVK